MPATIALRPYDVAVAIALATKPHDPYPALALRLGMSISTAHAAVKRLLLAGLLRQLPHANGRPTYAVNMRALLEFLVHGVRYAFPAPIGAHHFGAPTAHSGPALSAHFVLSEPLVWAAPHGSIAAGVGGATIAPLLPRAAELVDRDPALYAILTAVDALRVGRARERALAERFLRDHLSPTPHSAAVA